MKIKIDALDTLFFRDGKPFSLGEETWAEGLFPPAPSVLYGALRSLYFSLYPNDMGKAGNDDDPTQNLRIKGLYFLINGKLHFECPLDYVQEKGNEEPCLLKLSPLPEALVASSFQLSHCLTPPKGIQVEKEEGIIDHSTLEEYALENHSIGGVNLWSDYLQVEPKVGIGRSKLTNTTREGLLYRVGMVRPAANKNTATRRLSIVIDFEGLPTIETLSSEGFFKLGGEGKAVRYEVFDKAIELPSQVVAGQDIFKLLLLTPALFDNGWCPASIDPNTGKGTLSIDPQTSIEVELLAAVTGKPTPVGGFDIKTKQPKTMLRAVPAGAVYYFRLANAEDAPWLQQKFRPGSLSDQRANEGFGLALFVQSKQLEVRSP
jgi:CRISPR-associated protein Cmr3